MIPEQLPTTKRVMMIVETWRDAERRHRQNLARLAARPCQLPRRPDYVMGSVFDLGEPGIAGMLRAHGIRGLAFDVDKTLGPHDCNVLDEPVLQLLASLPFVIGLATNSARDLSAMAASVGAASVTQPVDGRRGKPNPLYFAYIAADMGLPPEQIAMVGDKLWFDMPPVGYPMKGILVKPIAGPPSERLYRLGERSALWRLSARAALGSVLRRSK